MMMRAVALALLLVVASQGVEGKLEKFRVALRPMYPGEVLQYTDSNQLIPTPSGRVAIRMFNSQLVDSAGNPVSASTAYLHHWTTRDFSGGASQTSQSWAEAFSSGKSTQVGPCNAVLNSFAKGAEWRGYPDPYRFEGSERWILDGSEQHGTNLHVIDLRGVPIDQVQSCVQCECQYVSNNFFFLQGGGLQCCTDGSSCQSTLSRTAANQRQYFLELIFEYDDITADRSFIPAYTSRLAAPSSEFSSELCSYEYDAPQCVDADGNLLRVSNAADGVCREGNVSRVTSSWVVPTALNVLYVLGHAHIGVYHTGIAVYHDVVDRDGNMIDRKLLCRSKPLYGKPGSTYENFVEYMTDCRFDNDPVKLAPGDVITTVTEHWATPNPMPPSIDGGQGTAFGAPYYGVMSYTTLIYTLEEFGIFSARAPIEAIDIAGTSSYRMYGEEKSIDEEEAEKEEREGEDSALSSSQKVEDKKDSDENSCDCSTSYTSGTVQVDAQGCAQHNLPTSSTFYCYIVAPATCRRNEGRFFRSSTYLGAAWRECDPLLDATDVDEERASSCTGSSTDLRTMASLAEVESIFLDNLDAVLFYTILNKNETTERETRLLIGLEYNEDSWAAIGFGSDGMINSDMVISRRDPDELVEYWSVTYGEPVPKREIGSGISHGLEDCLILREGGLNYFQFSRPLIMKDKNSELLALSNNITGEGMVAIGFSNYFDYHGPRSAERVRLALDVNEAFDGGQ